MFLCRSRIDAKDRVVLSYRLERGYRRVGISIWVSFVASWSKRARLVPLPTDSPERPTTEAELARLEASASQVRAWQAEDAIELAQLQAEVTEARAALRALETRSEGVNTP